MSYKTYHYVTQLGPEAKKSRLVDDGGPGYKICHHGYILRSLKYSSVYFNEGSENVLRTEALSKYYSVLSLPPCCSFTEVISFRPPTMSPADQQKKRSYDHAMMSPADRREQKRSYDQRLVNCACSLSYCKRTVTSTTRRKHRKKMREIASTQGDVAQDDGKDKKDGKVFILLSTTSYR